MTESWTYTGKTVDEAVELALKTLEVNLEDIEIEIVSPGRSGIMGLGGKLAEITVRMLSGEQEKNKRAARGTKSKSRPARSSSNTRGSSRVSAYTASTAARYVEKHDEGLKEHDPDMEKFVSELLEYLLGSMGLNMETSVNDELEDGHVVFDLRGEDAGLLIGNYGETLQALQSIVRLIARQKRERKSYVILDVEGYRGRRATMLKKLAHQAAQNAVSRREAQSIPPMSPADRRLIHLYLSDDKRVRTASKGTGSQRHVVVVSLQNTKDD